jgi:hypothetical protein
MGYYGGLLSWLGRCRRYHLGHRSFRSNRAQRLFCHITRNWQGVLLETLEVVVNLIVSTTTDKGLEVHSLLGNGLYQKRRKITSE